jgi:hypothetical protein
MQVQNITQNQDNQKKMLFDSIMHSYHQHMDRFDPVTLRKETESAARQQLEHKTCTADDTIKSSSLSDEVFSNINGRILENDQSPDGDSNFQVDDSMDHLNPASRVEDTIQNSLSEFSCPTTGVKKTRNKRGTYKKRK